MRARPTLVITTAVAAWLMAAAACAQMPPGMTPAAASPDTATARLSGPQGFPVPLAIGLATDSLEIGGRARFDLIYPLDGRPETAELESDSDWLVIDAVAPGAEANVLTVEVRLYRTGPCRLAWDGDGAVDSGIFAVAGRLDADDRPHAVRDPRPLGVYGLRIGLAGLAVVLLLLLLLWLRSRRRIAETPPPPPFTPPAWMVAARELWALQQRDLPRRGETRPFLHGVDLALRRYLGLRHGGEATEMTSTEVVAMLRDHGATTGEIDRAANWLADCDRLRFDKGEVRPEACDRLLAGAVDEIRHGMDDPCPEDVPGSWRYESEQCWNRLEGVLTPAAKGGEGV